MRPWIRCALLVSTFFVALGQERFKTGELKGFIKSPTEHIIERLEKIPTLQKLEGFVGSKELDQPLEGVLIEIRGPGEPETVRMAKSNQKGRFRFGRIADGAYTIKLTLNGFRSVVGAIAVQRSLKSSEAGEPFRIYMLSGV
jgi:hypothetical protein